MFLYEYKMERGIAMDSRVESYFEDIKGKRLRFWESEAAIYRWQKSFVKKVQ